MSFQRAPNDMGGPPRSSRQHEGPTHVAPGRPQTTWVGHPCCSRAGATTAYPAGGGRGDAAAARRGGRGPGRRSGAGARHGGAGRGGAQGGAVGAARGGAGARHGGAGRRAARSARREAGRGGTAGWRARHPGLGPDARRPARSTQHRRLRHAARRPALGPGAAAATTRGSSAQLAWARRARTPRQYLRQHAPRAVIIPDSRMHLWSGNSRLIGSFISWRSWNWGTERLGADGSRPANGPRSW
jgi:hypothetical protein